jgi:hypothetical protein
MGCSGSFAGRLDVDEVRDDVRGYAVGHLGDPDGVVTLYRPQS